MFWINARGAAYHSQLILQNAWKPSGLYISMNGWNYLCVDWLCAVSILVSIYVADGTWKRFGPQMTWAAREDRGIFFGGGLFVEAFLVSWKNRLWCSTAPARKTWYNHIEIYLVPAQHVSGVGCRVVNWCDWQVQVPKRAGYTANAILLLGLLYLLSLDKTTLKKCSSCRATS